MAFDLRLRAVADTRQIERAPMHHELGGAETRRPPNHERPTIGRIGFGGACACGSRHGKQHGRKDRKYESRSDGASHENRLAFGR